MAAWLHGCCMAASSLVFRLHERGPELVREVLLERGWEEYDEGQREEEDWNLYWRGSAFRSAEYHKLLPWQRLNHHPKTVGITRKDCLARNLRRMRATFSSSLYDFSPTAFILPNDFTRFLSEYDRQRLTQTLPVYWICKPVRLSRGRGIFIFENIKDLIYDCSVIVQRYVSDPLLISGYKFDLRIYVCVKSFHPLTVYIHQEGLVRFSTEKYNLSSLQNLYAHLTNTSINKFGPFYKTEKQQVGQGCKWTMSKFRHFLHSQGTDELLLWQRINNIVTLTLLTIAPSVPSCPNCVELFGFDILIDVRFKPWLLEVNYSPALTLDCQADIAVKKGLIGDLIDLMSYKSIDGLRERAYRRRGGVSIPVMSNVQKRRRSQTQTLPLIKTFHQTERTKQRKSKKHGSIPVCQRLLDRNLNLILGSRWRTDRQTCPGLASSLQVSEPMNHNDTETETETQLSAETDVSSQIPDIPPQALRFKSPAASCRLPDIHRVGRIRPVRIHQEAETSSNSRHVPPLRVGGFIRTFPFNTATLKASRHTLDVKTVIQEIHKLTNQLAAGRSVRKRPKSSDGEEKEKKSSDGEEKEKKSSDGEEEEKKSSDGEEKEKKSSDGEEKEKKSSDGEEKEKKSSDGEEKEKKSSDGEEKEKKSSDGEEEEKKKSSDGEEKEKKSSDGEEEEKKKSSDGEEEEKKKSSDREEKEKKKSSDGEEKKKKKKSSDREEKEKISDGEEEEFESLFWGPNDPPLISQCFKHD